MLRSKFSWYLHHNYSQFSTCQSSMSFRQSSSFSCDMLWSLFRLSSPSSCFLSWALGRDSTRGATVDHPCCQVELGPDPAPSSAKRPGHKKTAKKQQEQGQHVATYCNILHHIARPSRRLQDQEGFATLDTVKPGDAIPASRQEQGKDQVESNRSADEKQHRWHPEEC